MASKSWFSFKWFLLGFFVALFVFLVGMPVCSSSTNREARGAEGEQMLGSMKGMVRVAFDKTDGHVPLRLTGPREASGANVEPGELLGKYYRVLDHVSPRGTKGVALFAVPIRRKTPVITLEFQLTGGDGKYNVQHGGGQ